VKRFFLAAGLAVAFHVFLLGTEPKWLNKKFSHKPGHSAVTLTLAYRQPPPDKKPAVIRAERPLNNDVAIHRDKNELYTKPKPKLNPTPKPLPEPAKPDLNEEPSYPTHDFPEDVLEEQEAGETGQVVSVPTVPLIREARPVYRNNPPPEYPRLARKRGYEGTVILEVLVDKKGKAGSLRVLTSSGYPILDRAALATVEGWLFEPGMRGNERVEMWVRIPIRFELK
jgi:protein TonB